MERTNTQKIYDQINKLIDQIWDEYDKDGNGVLDKKEAKPFIQQTLNKTGQHQKLNDWQYNAIFDQFDEDGDGTIAK